MIRNKSPTRPPANPPRGPKARKAVQRRDREPTKSDETFERTLEDEEVSPEVKARLLDAVEGTAH